LSRNQDRLGGGSPQNSSPPNQLAQPQAESFSFVVPTEFVELPSKGLYYPEGHPLYNEETIEIKHMTAKEEDMLTSRALLKKGIALERLLASIIVDKRINPNSLLVGDRNAVLIAARISGYGSEYATKISCPQCAATVEHTFYLHELQTKETESASTLGVTSNGDGTFDTVLPKLGAQVTFRLLSGADEKSFMAQIESARKRNRAENTVTTQLSHMIIAVNGDDSSGLITELIQNMPSMDSRHLRLAYRLSTPDIDMSQHFSCNECGYEQEMEVPLTADFFWPDR
tara:strand:+ start:1178 stop:2032 length:855 start_codon:yes stop_codon:yes gene_type:complete